MTFLNFSPSESCLEGVWEVVLTMLPVGLDFLVSTGDLQNPVTCSAVFNKFSISNEFVLDVNFIPPAPLSIDDVVGLPFSGIKLR